MPQLLLQRLESGQRLGLAELAAGRPLVVNLWASWCGPCRAEMPVLAAAQARHAGRIGFAFVNSGESAEQVRSWLQQQGLSLQQVLLDREAALGPLLGSSGLPTTLFYDAQGRLQHAHMGVLNGAALQARLDAL
jgi:thiol-disulfide isomerase/thioredoxin